MSKDLGLIRVRGLGIGDDNHKSLPWKIKVISYNHNLLPSIKAKTFITRLQSKAKDGII